MFILLEIARWSLGWITFAELGRSTLLEHIFRDDPSLGVYLCLFSSVLGSPVRAAVESFWRDVVLTISIPETMLVDRCIQRLRGLLDRYNTI